MSVSWKLFPLLLAYLAGVVGAQEYGSPPARLHEAVPLQSELNPPLDIKHDFVEPRETDSTDASKARPFALAFASHPTHNADGFQIVPYGAFWADMTYATSRTNPGAFTLFVLSAGDQGESAFSIDARRSRFGLDLAGPEMRPLGPLREMHNVAKVEIDFQGNFVTENRASVLLRHAYWELKNETFKLLVGQTWDVISPLNPGMLDYAVGLNAGNIGFRRTQFRAERYLSLSRVVQLTLQASLNQDIVADFPAEDGVRREPSDWPVVEARTALRWHVQDGHEVVFGFSGHIGETGFDFLDIGPPPLNLPPTDDARFETWSLNVDVQVPITKRMGVQGEFFTGANLSAFFGAIGQGVCPCLRTPIRSTGGWGELWYDWSPQLHSQVGFGLDDPNNRDSLFGRTYNQMYFANVSRDVTDRLITGLEVTYRKTLYQETRGGLIPSDQLTPTEPGESLTIDWMLKYAF